MAMTPRQKFARYTEPTTTKLDKGFAGVPAGALLHISTPAALDARIRAIPSGQTLSLVDLRREFAELNDADATCPMTTSMYVRIVADVALLDLEEGASIDDITPFWRVVEPDSAIAKRIDGARDFIADRRRAEGIG